jgi:Yip1 domain
MSEPNDNFQPPPPPTSPAEPPRGSRPTLVRQVGIVVFVLGLLVVGGGAAKVIAGGLGTGLALAFLGIVLFGLSFVRLPLIPESEEPLSLIQKVTGIFFEPSRVFRNLRAHPRWAGAFILIVVLNGIYAFAFVQRITPERIVNHTVDKMAEMGPPFAPPPDRLEAIRADQLEALKNPVQRVGTFAKSFVGGFVFIAALPAALSLLGILAFGGRINFWQSMAVVVYSTLPVVLIHKLLSLILLYIKAPDDLHPILNQETLVQDNLGILITPAAHPVLFVMASVIGLTSFYGLWLRAKGLKDGGTRVGNSAAWGVAITLWLLFLLFITIITALFPGFIS